MSGQDLRRRSVRTRKPPARFQVEDEKELFSDDYAESEHDSDYDYAKSDVDSVESIDSEAAGGGSGSGGIEDAMSSLNLSSDDENDSLYEMMVKNDQEDELYMPHSDSGGDSDGSGSGDGE